MLSPLLREPLARADARVAVSPALSERIESFGLPRPRFIPNLVDERMFRAAPVRASHGFTFLTVGAMQQAKGVGDLIQAIAILKGRVDSARWKDLGFRLIGDGPDRGTFQSDARRLGIESSIAWTDPMPREQLIEEFQACDCYVLPSHHESFGIVLVEALASGRPLIATRCGGPESIVNESNGVLVAARDPQALAQALESMLHRARRYDPEALRADFMSRYSRQAVVNALDDVYEEVTNQRRE
jgi:glycosyltransferase involved in cell wall biosynthesis